MKKFLAILLLVGCIGCGGGVASKQFYVQSTSQGYVVAHQECCPGGSTIMSKPFQRPEDADNLATRLNREMREDWPK